MTELANKITQIAETITSFKGEYGDRLLELERRYARSPTNDNNEYVSRGTQLLGDRVIADQAVKHLTSSFRGKAAVKFAGEMAAITSGPATVGATTSTGTSLVPAHRLPTIVEPYRRQWSVRDLFPVARTTSNSIEYPRETGFTNNARMVTEGQGKPYSDITFNLVNAPVRTLAHLFKMSRQILDDAPALAAYINSKGTYGLKLVEDSQVLYGNGSGQNLNGVVPQASDYDAARNSTGDSDLDILNHAISQCEEAEVPASGIVLSRKDWRNILGIKDDQGRYLSEGPFGTTAPRIWGLPVIPTNAFTSGQFLVGAFEGGAEIFDRLEVEVLLSTENDLDFEKNLATARIEERLALAVYRPEAFVFGSF